MYAKVLVIVALLTILICIAVVKEWKRAIIFLGIGILGVSSFAIYNLTHSVLKTLAVILIISALEGSVLGIYTYFQKKEES
ncbi:hypothetical protein E5329_21055 [Petralouisia muris]|uniref:Uncharacterized protein n=1 Tax=Petralouisia muris TaxID=3032872 RepID=A0AC61RQU5_9FIRM|nr:hypothetical protein [Petralouisia muris]MCI8860488.1 hypothetical protein [Lachnospiraceae bacterium]TGY91462.1 hypothetical protein E5329_21055 [Petralouisia muris]